MTDMGPATRMINQIVDLHKDLDAMESRLDNPDSKPLGNVDPFDVTDPHAQGLLDIVKKMAPDADDPTGKENVLADAEKLKALLTEDLLPLGANLKRGDKVADMAKAKEDIKRAHQVLDDITANMGLNPEQKSQVKVWLFFVADHSHLTFLQMIFFF